MADLNFYNADTVEKKQQLAERFQGFLKTPVEDEKQKEFGLPNTYKRLDYVNRLSQPTPEALEVQRQENPGFLEQLGIGVLKGASYIVAQPAKLATGGLVKLNEMGRKAGLREPKQEPLVNKVDRWLGKFIEDADYNFNTPVENITSNLVQFGAGAVTGAIGAAAKISSAARAGSMITQLQNVSGPANYLMAHHSNLREWTAGLLEMGANILTSGVGDDLVKGFTKVGMKNLGQEVVTQAAKESAKLSLKQTSRYLLSAATQDLLAANTFNIAENMKADRPIFENWKETSTVWLSQW